MKANNINGSDLRLTFVLLAGIVCVMAAYALLGLRGADSALQRGKSTKSHAVPLQILPANLDSSTACQERMAFIRVHNDSRRQVEFVLLSLDPDYQPSS